VQPTSLVSFCKMAIILSHSHFLNVAFVSIMVFQTFDRITFGTLAFPGTSWYMLTSCYPQMVRDPKSLGTSGLQTLHFSLAYITRVTNLLSIFFLLQSIALHVAKSMMVTPTVFVLLVAKRKHPSNVSHHKNESDKYY